MISSDSLFYDPIFRILIALAVGIIMGLEREVDRTDRTVIAGIRTFPIVALMGALLAVVSETFPYGVAIGLVSATVLAAAFYYGKFKLDMTGLTGPAALISVYIIGAAIGYGYIIEGLICGIAIAFLLTSREILHRFASLLNRREILEALQFITIVFILYPLVPTEIEIPFITINPRWILSIIIFVSALSFISFILLRKYSVRYGLRASGLLGGLVSSNAIVGSLTVIARQNKAIHSSALAGLILANSSMMIRNFLVSGFADPTFKVAYFLFIPNICMCAIGFLLAYRTPVEKDPKISIELKSPFALRPAVEFAFYFLLISVLSTFAIKYLGDFGLIISSLGGLVSSVAVTASVATMAYEGLITPVDAAKTAILAGIISTIGKIFLIRVFNREMVKIAVRPFLIVGFSGLILLLILIMLFSPP